MERKKTYQELLKEYTMTQNQKEAKALQWYTEIFLNDLLQKRREEQLRAEIDLALDQRDKKAFTKLSKELINHIGK
ncbi:IDEAL domain-containing protein [Bacillus norwichensis]|uniref:IDEAL domain-containing protein n=1 Tax=Bacillus norwichensis TaxID=2762217 RepID=A0ABR8VGF3_9BACI|nr:IDEAL domain-containing protein [Bacillus norwichensis]MBD8003813.1 IDEAL domain-containing protein [Bacillus norwichensis]